MPFRTLPEIGMVLKQFFQLPLAITGSVIHCRQVGAPTARGAGGLDLHASGAFPRPCGQKTTKSMSVHETLRLRHASGGLETNQLIFDPLAILAYIK